MLTVWVIVASLVVAVIIDAAVGQADPRPLEDDHEEVEYAERALRVHHGYGSVGCGVRVSATR